jgi:hypothetical protein
MFACKMRLKPGGNDSLTSSYDMFKFHICLSVYTNTPSISRGVCRFSPPSPPPPLSQCWRSLQLRITISTCNPRVRLLSTGNFEDVTSFSEGFRSLGMWYLLVTSNKNGDLNFIALKPSKLSGSCPPLKITFFYSCEFIFSFQYEAKYFLPRSVTDLQNNSGSPLLSTWIKNSIMWRTHRLVLHTETVWSEMKRVRATKWRNEEARVTLHILCDQTHVGMRKTFLKQDVLMMGSSVLP